VRGASRVLVICGCILIVKTSSYTGESIVLISQERLCIGGCFFTSFGNIANTDISRRVLHRAASDENGQARAFLPSLVLPFRNNHLSS